MPDSAAFLITVHWDDRVGAKFVKEGSYCVSDAWLVSASIVATNIPAHVDAIAKLAGTAVLPDPPGSRPRSSLRPCFKHKRIVRAKV